jgi:glycosyltransferase involved in cell wall biosynthesis
MDDNALPSQPELSVVIPLYKEEANIVSLLNTLLPVLKTLPKTHELILVDDGSPDNTWELLKEKAAIHPTILALRLSRNFGKEAAMRAGLETAVGQAVITMDGDLQHPPRLIPDMVEVWEQEGAEIVEANKTYRGPESLLNKFSAKIFYYILNKLSGYNINNASDFKLLDRKAVDALLAMNETNMFYRGMTTWLGFKKTKIFFETATRQGGVSTWSFLQRLNLSLTAITSFSVLPLYFVTAIGLLFFLFSIGLGLQTLYHKFSGQAVSGFTTVILLLLIIGSLLMFSLGIIGEYIARIYQEAKGRPRYIVTEKIRRPPESKGEK